MDIRAFTDPALIKSFRAMRWDFFRAPHGLPRGSEVYDGEENATYIGAFEGDALIGGVLYIPRSDSCVQMHHLIVHETHQSKGYGKQLIESIEPLAASRGFETVLAHARTHMRPLYERCGYADAVPTEVPASIPTNHAPGVPHVMMVKTLHVHSDSK